MQKTLAAISVQTVMPTEIIVVNNGSTDSTETVIKSFIKLPIYTIFEARVGRAIARNRGVLRSRYELIFFTDDDCIPPIDWIEKMVEYHLLKRDVLAIYGRVIFYGENRQVVTAAQLLNDKFNSDNIYMKNDTIFSQSFDTANLSLKRTFFEKYGLFDNKLSATQDVELAKRVGEHTDLIVYEPTLIVNHFARSSLFNLLYQYFLRGLYLVKWDKRSRLKVIVEFFCFPLYLIQMLKKTSRLKLATFCYLFLTLLVFNIGCVAGKRKN